VPESTTRPRDVLGRSADVPAHDSCSGPSVGLEWDVAKEQLADLMNNVGDALTAFRFAAGCVELLERLLADD